MTVIKLIIAVVIITVVDAKTHISRLHGAGGKA